ncbi:energy-coupling factor transporter transmembrane protein EcfT [Herbiconiux sp. CPCC 205763]|uniref:Energy-coupling factor transporter transmembrane protein EcfT n=1 Tax=Herbiconiux aconitum TaxID=2970913 RepID=A0ABT2GR00_9MICO|nr:energy-coupling factor transporter transmembrane component T [Herbiconiux aconitum]MCS5718655.1 energy-coupling factor transporter transmembrane protein EcfT [Herbiconiux aconitum]
MTVLAPPRGTRRIHSINPVAKLAASLVLSAILLVTIDWVSAAVALALESVLFVWAGLGPRAFFRRTFAIWIAAPLAGLTTLLYGVTSGQVYWQFLLMEISDGSISLAVATVLRILAIGLPAVVLFATIDPTDLADGLAQVWHLPSRFVLGALAGLRLIALFLQDWRQLELARRARGLGDSGRLRRFASQAFALLVISIRRGSKLATAMEARGFGGATVRTWARESSFGGREWLLVLVGAAIGAVAIAVAVATGSFNFIIG